MKAMGTLDTMSDLDRYGVPIGIVFPMEIIENLEKFQKIQKNFKKGIDKRASL